MLSLKIAEGNSTSRGSSSGCPGDGPIQTDQTDDRLEKHILKALFEGPCKCCGEPTHGVFEQITGKGGMLRVSISCSVTQEEDWEQALKSGLRSMRFKADYGKMAEANDNDATRLEAAMKSFIVNGEGRFMQYLELVDFENDLHRYRKAMRGQHRFKRESREKEDSLDWSTGSDQDQL